MQTYDDSGSISVEALERMQLDKPVAIYTKTTVGKVGVMVFNPITRRPEDRILKGDPRDSNVNREDMLIKLYDEASHMFFKNMNRVLIEKGLIAPFTKEQDNSVQMLNAITDEEIDEMLEQPYFTLMNKIEKFTSPTPVERVLIRAIELNKGVKTTNKIKEKLVAMQQAEKLDDSRLDEYYKHLEDKVL
jgi:hypothetical protein